ncbi:MAG: D-alanyl-D-alanine carboxypeptidase family protein [Kiritimatiellia bacterium]
MPWAALCAVLVLTANAAPTVGKARARPAGKPVAVQAAKPSRPPQTAHRRSPYVGAISANAETGEVLFEDRADVEAYPASVTKLMTLLLVADDVRAGKYSFDDFVVATADAYKSEPSWVGIKVGEKMSVRDLCIALMVESANDAAIVLGVHASGSFPAFVARMNARAAELGMKRTRYYNPNGLPPKSKYPWKSFNVTTARDQLLLARALLARPEILAFTSVKTADLIRTATGYRVFVTRRVNTPPATTVLKAGEQLVKQMRNHNNVMRTDKLKILNPDGKEAVDGLKTGYIDAGGSSVVLTGSRDGKRAVVVVLGSATSGERDEQARHLLYDALGSLGW